MVEYRRASEMARRSFPRPEGPGGLQGSFPRRSRDAGPPFPHCKVILASARVVAIARTRRGTRHGDRHRGQLELWRRGRANPPGHRFDRAKGAAAAQPSATRSRTRRRGDGTGRAADRLPASRDRPSLVLLHGRPLGFSPDLRRSAARPSRMHSALRASSAASKRRRHSSLDPPTRARKPARRAS